MTHCSCGDRFWLVVAICFQHMVNQVPPEVLFRKNNTVLTQVFLPDVVHSLKQPEFPHLLQRWVSLSVKQSLHSQPGEDEPKWCEAECENACACFIVKKVSVWFTVSLCPEPPPDESSTCVSLRVCVCECLCAIWSSCLSLHFQSHSSHLSGLYGVPPASAITHQHSVCCLKSALQSVLPWWSETFRLISCLSVLLDNYCTSWWHCKTTTHTHMLKKLWQSLTLGM